MDLKDHNPAFRKYEEKFYQHGLEVSLHYEKDPIDNTLRVRIYPYPIYMDRVSLDDPQAIAWASYMMKEASVEY